MAKRSAIIEQVRAEAVSAGKRRQLARTIGQGANGQLPTPALDLAGRIMELAGPQSPGAAIALVKSRWPEIWSRIVIEARDTRQAPGALMVALIERGLDENLGGGGRK